jgi:hypothetical protein
VVLPLLKTITLLMNRMCVDSLVQNGSFSSSLLSLLQKEEIECKDVHRLTAIINVSLGLMTASESEKVLLPASSGCLKSSRISSSD